MENMIVEATKSTPSLFFDAERGILDIRGKSYPENAAKFYGPAFEWISTYLNSTQADIVRFDLEIIYLNSSSSKALLNLFDLMEGFAKTGREAVINWHYHEENETALELGEEFKEELESATFNLVKIRDE